MKSYAKAMCKMKDGGSVPPKGRVDYKGFSVDPSLPIPKHLQKYVKDGRYTHVNAYITPEGILVNPDEAVSGIDVTKVKPVMIPSEDYGNYLNTGVIKTSAAYPAGIMGLPTGRRVIGVQAPPAVNTGLDIDKHIALTPYDLKMGNGGKVPVNIEKGELIYNPKTGKHKEMVGENPQTGTSFQRHKPEGVVDPKANIVDTMEGNVVIPNPLAKSFKNASPVEKAKIADYVSVVGGPTADGKNFLGALIGAAPAIFKGISGLFQKRKANKINAVDPGYTMNQDVINNAKQMEDYYKNYELPGKQAALDQIGLNAANALEAAKQTGSSGDLLDMATKAQYGSNRAINDLSTQEAINKDALFAKVLASKAMRGQEFTNKNAYDRDKYMQKLQEKAALTESANRNLYGALDDVGSMAQWFKKKPANQFKTVGSEGFGVAPSVFGNKGGGFSDWYQNRDIQGQIINPKFTLGTR